MLIRPWMNQWGAASSDLTRVMAGDSLLPHPTYSATMAVVVNTPPEHVSVEPSGGRTVQIRIAFLTGMRTHTRPFLSSRVPTCDTAGIARHDAVW